MLNEVCKKLDEALIRERLGDVTDITQNKSAWVLLQEPGFIGFGVVQKSRICWPPDPNKPRGWTPDWARVSDLRLFGEKGEWHVWLDWERKHQCRLLEFDQDVWRIWLGWDRKDQCAPEKVGKEDDILSEHHALWGTEVKCEGNPWVKLREDRGAEIWMPPLKGKKLKNADLPLRLKLKQVVDYDPKYHLAGIIDAALVGLVPQASEDRLLPDDSLLC